MRKIKFRAQAKVDKCWIFGAWQSSNPTFLFDTYPNGQVSEEIIPDTVGEFTGLSDSSGRKIFEGDILKNTQNDGLYSEGKVTFYNGCWYLEYFDHGYTNLHWALKSQALHVVGNIHEKGEVWDYGYRSS